MNNDVNQVDGAWLEARSTTIPAVFEHALICRGPDFEFLNYSGTQYSLGWLDSKSTRLAHGLLASGVHQGQTVTSILDNCVEQFLLLLACSKIGAIHVPLNTAYKGEYLRHQVVDSGAAIVVAEGEYVQRLLDIAEKLPAVKQLLIKGGMPSAQSKIELKSLGGAFSDDESPIDYTAKPEDLAMLIYTAGTTGPSKGCMVSQGYTCNQARQISTTMGYGPDDVVWTPLPGFHMAQYTGTVLGALMVLGRAAVYPRFSVSRFWNEVEEAKATALHILSSMFSLIANAPDNEASVRCYGQVKTVFGTPLPPELEERWKSRFGVTHTAQTCFGLTECALVTSLDIEQPRPPYSSGKRNDDFDVRIVDEFEQEVSPGEPGEIIIRPKRPHVMFDGYWKRPEETLKLFRNCWFHTGDIGKFDEEGFFYFVDRKKDYLRRRGENISSMEVEGVFMQHPDIAEVAVHAVLADLEDDVKVTCTLRPNATLTEDQLCRWSIDNLPYFVVPRFIEFRPFLPKNPVGRILKNVLRDEGVTKTTWDKELSNIEIKKR